MRVVTARGHQSRTAARIAALAAILCMGTAAAPGDTVALVGRADGDAIARTLAEAKRQRLSEVKIAPSQSFRVARDGRTIATLVTGRGDMPGAPYAGCFVAIVQRVGVKLIPTIGHGDYETTTCGEPVAVGIVSMGEPIGIGVIFRSYSPNATVLEPVVLRWVPSNATLSIDVERSRRASLAGAQSTAAMRRAVR